MKRRNSIFFLLFAGIVFLFLCFLHIVLGPLIIAIIVSYLMNPVLQFFEKKGVSRGISTAFFISTFFILVSILVWILFPLLITQFESLIKRIPEFQFYLENILFPKIQRGFIGIVGNNHYKSIKIYDLIPFNIEDIGTNLLMRIDSGTRFVFSWIIFIIITPAFLFFFMRDLPKIYTFFLNLVPHSARNSFQFFFREVDKKLRAVLRGQILVVIILCLLYPSAFLLAGLPAAIAVGVLISLARLIPYMDVLIGSFLCFFVLVTNTASNHQIGMVIIAFFSVQLLDWIFITPRIIGRFSELHPFLVILSVLCFGDWFGFYGILLAIPAATVTKVAFSMLVKLYKNSDYFKHGNRK